MSQTWSITDLMKISPVIPVIVIDDPEAAIPLAEALVAGGLRILEITLRTDAALRAIENIASAVSDAIVGAGTVTRADDVQHCIDAGAGFAVSPGYTATLGAACSAANLPYLPGVMTPADILCAHQGGYNALKFFPAGAAGGRSFLKALSGPFVRQVFCPTGGINAENASDYLALDNVLCVGGSWVAPRNMIRARDWQGIEALARRAAALQQRDE